MSIPYLDFPVEDVKLELCYRNEKVLAALEEGADKTVCLPKLAAAYDPITFPVIDKVPYTFASIVLSFDGKMAFPDFPEGPIISKKNLLDPKGGLADFWILNNLRAYADATIVGANTLASEPNVWMTVHDKELVNERMEYLKKASEHPYNVVVSLDGSDIPVDHMLFAQKEVPVSVFTSKKGWEVLKGDSRFELVDVIDNGDDFNVAAVKAGVTEFSDKVPVVVTDKGGVPDTILFMEVLKKIGLDHVLIESPTYMWHLMSLGLLNEFFLNYSSVYVGGRISPGGGIPFTSEDHPHGELLLLARHESHFLFTRQQLIYGLR